MIIVSPLSPNDKMTAPFEPDLLQNLLSRAAERRSLHILAMAFRLKYPRWGSQSVLITLGLSGFLDMVKWDFDSAEYRILDYLDVSDNQQSNYLRGLRLTQIRHLAELNNREETFTLRPADPSERATQLTWMANQGFLLCDLKAAIHEELSAEEYSRLSPLISSLTVEQYINAVHPDDRGSHPNALNERVMYFKQRILHVFNEYATNSIGTAPRSGRIRA